VKGGGETVLISGASYGIGRELAREFARHGHDLVLVARSADKLEQLADELAAESGVLVSVRPADLSLPGAAAKLHKALQREGFEVDILVNNAGVLEHGHFADIPAEDHRRMIDLNVAGLTDMIAQFLPEMLVRGSGRIMNVASIGAFMPVPTLATYAATKAFVLSLSEALEVVAAKKQADLDRILHTFEGTDVQILKGRWGPFISDGKKNARMPKDREPESMTLEECLAALEAAPDKRSRKKVAKKATGKKATRKKASKKKTARKKTTRKKAAGKRSARKKAATEKAGE